MFFKIHIGWERGGGDSPSGAFIQDQIIPPLIIDCRLLMKIKYYMLCLCIFKKSYAGWTCLITPIDRVLRTEMKEKKRSDVCRISDCMRDVFPSSFVFVDEDWGCVYALCICSSDEEGRWCGCAKRCRQIVRNISRGNKIKTKRTRYLKIVQTPIQKETRSERGKKEKKEKEISDQNA